MENRPPSHVSLNNSAVRPSFKNLYDTFWASGQIYEVFLYIFEKWPILAELKFKMAEVTDFWIFSFPALPLKGTCEVVKCKQTFDICVHLVKEPSYRYFKDGLAAELLRETCEGGLFLCVFFTA